MTSRSRSSAGARASAARIAVAGIDAYSGLEGQPFSAVVAGAQLVSTPLLVWLSHGLADLSRVRAVCPSQRNVVAPLFLARSQFRCLFSSSRWMGHVRVINLG